MKKSVAKQTKPKLRLGLPKGSLQDATIEKMAKDGEVGKDDAALHAIGAAERDAGAIKVAANESGLNYFVAVVAGVADPGRPQRGRLHYGLNCAKKVGTACSTPSQIATCSTISSP